TANNYHIRVNTFLQQPLGSNIFVSVHRKLKPCLLTGRFKNSHSLISCAHIYFKKFLLLRVGNTSLFTYKIVHFVAVVQWIVQKNANKVSAIFFGNLNSIVPCTGRKL